MPAIIVTVSPTTTPVTPTEIDAEALRRSSRLLMIGSSKNSVDRVAIPSATSETSSRTGHDDAPVTVSKRTIAGQCQRYQA